MASSNKRIVFVTVGSTRFDDLVEKVLSEEIGRKLVMAKFDRLMVQSGNSQIKTNSSDNSDLFIGGDTWNLSRYGLSVEICKFKPDLRESFIQADLVICHAGTYTYHLSIDSVV